MAGWNDAINSFLLAFPALFSIVNPIGGALIFSQVTADLNHEQRARLAGRIGIYSALVMVISLGAGSYVMNFFGITTAALRIAGGLVVAVRAYSLLEAPERNEAMKQKQATSSTVSPEDSAFFPLTMPFTTGPGTISVAIALGANRPSSGLGLAEFFAGVSAAAGAMAILIWVTYAGADRVVALLGESRARVVTRLAAFLLLCVGTQILVNGIQDVLRPVLAGAAR